MPTDSLYIFSNSFDQVFLFDSLANRTDSLQTAVSPSVPSGFEGLIQLSLPRTENWVFILLFALFLLFAFAVRINPNLLSEDIKSIFKTKERSSIFSSQTAQNTQFRILFVIFACCVISLYAYVIFYKPETNDFSFIVFLSFLLVTSVFFIFKLLFINLLGFIFFDPKIMSIARKSFSYIIVILGTALFPLLIVYIYGFPEASSLLKNISLVVCLGAVLFVVLKLFQIFFSKLLDSFYILLYLCTLEILPLLALFYVYQLIV